MTREYIEEMVKTKLLSGVICNQCGKRLCLNDDNFQLEKTEFYEFKEGFNYGSRYDGDDVRFDLCNDCFDKMIESFTVPAEIESIF